MSSSKQPSDQKSQSDSDLESKTPAQALPEPEPTDLGSKIGKFMIIGFWLLLLGLGYYWASRELSLMQNPNPTPTTAQHGGNTSVQLAINRYGHYVANGTINDSPVTFLLDTGATSVSVSSSLASRLELEPGRPVQLSTANGIVTGYSVSLESVAIGGLARNKVRAHINPGLPDGEVLLGMSYLRHFKLTQQGDILTIEQYP